MARAVHARSEGSRSHDQTELHSGDESDAYPAPPERHHRHGGRRNRHHAGACEGGRIRRASFRQLDGIHRCNRWSGQVVGRTCPENASDTRRAGRMAAQEPTIIQAIKPSDHCDRSSGPCARIHRPRNWINFWTSQKGRSCTASAPRRAIRKNGKSSSRTSTDSSRRMPVRPNSSKFQAGRRSCAGRNVSSMANGKSCTTSTLEPAALTAADGDLLRLDGRPEQLA